MQRIVLLGLTLGLLGQALSGQTPTPGKTLRQTAIALEEKGDVPQAEATWLLYIQVHSTDSEPYAHLGLLEARQENYPKAIEYYRKAIALKSTLPGLRLNLGLALFKAGDLKEAIPEFSRAMKSAPPGSAEAQRSAILLGMAHYGVGNYAGAVPFLKQAASRDPSNLPLRLTLAHSCLWSKQYACVLNVYHEILSLNSESAEADMLAGEASDEMHDRGGAVEQFRAAVKANPKEPNVHFGLGYLLWKQRELPEAATEFQAELANDPTHVQSILYLGDTYLQLERPEDARPYLEKAEGMDPTLWLAHLDLGILDADAKRDEDAQREMELAANLKPDEVNVHWRLGKLYRSMGKLEPAKAEFAKANALNKATDEGVVKKLSGGPAMPHADAPSTVPQGTN